MADTETLPALPPVNDDMLKRAGLPTVMEMSPGLAIFFDDAIYARCKHIASMMARGESMTPAHLRGKPEACFSVVSMSINWKMNPLQVARSTYETPGGNIGYEGKLIQAILELSGKIDGQIRFEHKGDWTKVRRKFKMQTGKTGKDYPVPTWTAEDAEGLYVTVSARMKGEEIDRTLDVYLDTCWPLNSPLWATDPRRQICYFAVRAFANLATPTLLFGIPFDVDPAGLAEMVDITPARPSPGDNEFRSAARSPDMGDWITRANFAETLDDVAKLRKEGLESLPADPPALRQQFEEVCDARARQIAAKIPAGQVAMADGNAVQEPGDQVEAPGPDKDGDKDESKSVNVEPPFKRGQRLLALCSTPTDVFELWLSISEELSKKKDLDLWRGTCEARWKEVGGTGKMPTKAAK